MARKVVVNKGDKYNQLTILYETERSLLGKRMFYCICTCGRNSNVALGDLRSGHTKSCGCQGRGVEFHAESHTVLYRQWRAMKSRALERGDTCFVCEEWEKSFISFKEWATLSGYKKGLVLCRDGDIGDYCPTNCRWDTFANNTVEARACYWEVKNPQGDVIEIYNLSEFCRDNSLSQSEMSRVNSGKRTSHKGWTCKKIDKRGNNDYKV